jgi:hypothetical protein
MSQAFNEEKRRHPRRAFSGRGWIQHSAGTTPVKIADRSHSGARIITGKKIGARERLDLRFKLDGTIMRTCIVAWAHAGSIGLKFMGGGRTASSNDKIFLHV